ncbi:MAG: DUF6115 domain-containing protein, partial [Eubacteriales bacterium]
LKQKAGSKKLDTSNTIIFPRRKDSFGDLKPVAGNSEPDVEIPPKHQMVYAMAKMGYSEEDIAKQMKIGRGEVRLILQLKRKGEEANA